MGAKWTSSLKTRIRTLESELKVAEAALESVKAIEPDLYERVRVRFRDELHARRAGLKNLRVLVDSGQVDKHVWVELDDQKAEHFFEGVGGAPARNRAGARTSNWPS